MRPVKPGIETVKLFGEDDHVAMICLSDERDFFHTIEVLSFGERDPDSISRVGAVGDDVLSVQWSHARVLHAKLLIFGKRTVALGGQKGLRIGGEAESVGASCQSYDGSSRAEMGAE